MKKLLFIATVFIAATAFITKAKLEPLAIGATMPLDNAKMKNITTGKDASLSELKMANGTLVVFSCNTCPFVIANQQRIYRLQKYAIGYNIGLAIVNSNEAKRSGDDSEEKMKTYGVDQRYYGAHLVDKNSKLADAMGATVTPECFLFDKNNKLVYHGAIDDSPRDEEAAKLNYLIDAMQSLNEAKPIAVPNTKGIGCGIKRK